MKNEIILGIAVAISFCAQYFWQKKFGRLMGFFSNGTAFGVALSLCLSKDYNIWFGAIALIAYIYNLFMMNKIKKDNPTI